MNRKAEKNEEKRYRGVSGVVSLCIGLLAAFLTAPSAAERKAQERIASEILRFHVLANSDGREDQEEKLRVRDAVIRELQPVLASADSKQETKELVKGQLDHIEEIADGMVSPRNARVSLETDWFPEKTYGDCTFPEGEYEALRIEIGEAAGHNWWCVLYPGLCFTDVVRPVVSEEGKETLEGILDEEAYDFVRYPAKMKVKFRWLTIQPFREANTVKG